MVFIKINKKWLNIFILILLIGSLGLNIYSIQKNNTLQEEYANKYQSLICMTSVLENTNLIYYVTSMRVTEYEDVEIFDISKGEVIKAIKSNSTIQDETLSYIKNVTGLYPKVDAFPKDGYIIRVPIKPEEKVNNPWLNDNGIQDVNQIFVIFPKDDKPYLLVLDKSFMPFFFSFEGDTELLLKQLSFPIAS